MNEKETKTNHQEGKLEETHEIIRLQKEEDTLISLADFAEKKIEAINKIKKACIALTNENDWLILDGTPYLTATGAEKISGIFGMSWHIIDVQKEIREDKYIWITKMIIKMADRAVEAIGTCASDDPFFSIRTQDGKKIKLSKNDVNECNVMKKSYTNALSNGIQRLLGIRKIDIEDLERAGLKISKIKKIKYGAEKENKKESEEENKKFDNLKEKLKALCLQCANGDEEKAKEICIEFSTFTSKNGDRIPGKIWNDFEPSEKHLRWIAMTIKNIESEIEKQQEFLRYRLDMQA